MTPEQYKYWTRTAQKDEVIVELTKRFSSLLDNYARKNAIYVSIHDMKDILDCLLERCQ
jgi:phenylpyruvate tautomerase PptA (4-oxalocrotonate tautomerase family)